eukprot:747573-Hanusia_phi.AAC.2
MGSIGMQRQSEGLSERAGAADGGKQPTWGATATDVPAAGGAILGLEQLTGSESSWFRWAEHVSLVQLSDSLLARLMSLASGGTPAPTRAARNSR